MRRIHALYANVVALGSSFQGHLRSDDNPVSLHMVLEGHSPSAGLRNEHEVVFLSDWLRFMLQTDTHTHSTVMDPAIYVIGFDDFISRKMWPGHEQQPGTKFTLAQVCCLAQSSTTTYLIRYRKLHSRRRDCFADTLHSWLISTTSRYIPNIQSTTPRD
jgi:hypothetical protein